MIEQRLTDEWVTHGKLIVAVDFDDTIFPYRMSSWGRCMITIGELLRMQDQMIIIIWTASAPERYPFIERYCKEVGLNIVGVNTPAIPNLKFGTESKPYFNILLDDRAGLDGALSMLGRVYDKINGNE
jgi:hypothetical protein